MAVPSLLLRQIYTFGSLTNLPDGIKFSIKNRLSDAQFTGLNSVWLDGQKIPLEAIHFELPGGVVLSPFEISGKQPMTFPLRQRIDLVARVAPIGQGKHQIEVHFETKPFGKLQFKVEDAIAEADDNLIRVPRSNVDDYSEEIIHQRQEFVRKFTGVDFQHISSYTFDPHVAKGNVENFTGVAQVPLGFGGPIRINGEHAQGDFLIPLATSEGTLVASYNRGIKLLNLCGGVKCTIVADAMQRAPVFVFDDARGAREFIAWVQDHIEQIRDEAQATSNVARLTYIDPYQANKFVYLRFNFTTGDAAGQNMVGRATFAACRWIIDRYPGIRRFYLESNFATDKKASQINIMRTRGKRVTSEAIIKRDLLAQHMRVDAEVMAYHYGVTNIGSILSGANNNGAQSANAITAMFIATGQDVATVAESSAGIRRTCCGTGLSHRPAPLTTNH